MQACVSYTIYWPRIINHIRNFIKQYPVTIMSALHRSFFIANSIISYLPTRNTTNHWKPLETGSSLLVNVRNQKTSHPLTELPVGTSVLVQGQVELVTLSSTFQEHLNASQTLTNLDLEMVLLVLLTDISYLIHKREKTVVIFKILFQKVHPWIVSLVYFIF